MNFSSISSKIIISGFDQEVFDKGVKTTEKELIRKAIETAYNKSPIAKKMINGWVRNKTIQINYRSKAFGADKDNKGTLWLDLDYIKDWNYITNTGKPVSASLMGALMHEFGHALKDLTDPEPPKDQPLDQLKEYKGTNLPFINTIWKQLGLPPMLSYLGTGVNSKEYGAGYQRLGYNYAKGQQITDAVNVEFLFEKRGFDFPRNWSTAKLSNQLSNVLLIGGSYSNTLTTGGGNDTLFGGGSDDILDGGGGINDAIYFGKRSDYQIDYQWGNVSKITDKFNKYNAGTDTLKNIQYAWFDDGPVHLAPNALTFQKNIAFVIDTTKNTVVFEPALTDIYQPIEYLPVTAVFSSLNYSKTIASALIAAIYADPDNDVQTGIVAFNDTTIGNPSQVILPFTDQDDFTARKAAALAAIDSLTASDGGDIAETTFDGLRLALNGSIGEWRYGAGTRQIFLFSDSPAKDYNLAGEVTALAHNIGATIESSSTVPLAGGAVNTFNLTFSGESSSLAATTAPDTAQVQIFTIFTKSTFTEASGSEWFSSGWWWGNDDITEFAAISNNNGGAVLTAPTNDDLIQQILAIVNPPPIEQPPEIPDIEPEIPGISLDTYFYQIPRNDFNGDGSSDILWRNTDGSMAIWELNGNKVTPKSVSSLTADWTIAGTGDFNGDLNADILFRNTNGTVATWQLDRSSITSTSVIGTAPLDWTIAGTGDFNGDSESDILWRNTNGNIAIWELNDATLTTASVIGAVTPDWKIAGTDDFNGDGESDILWRNDNGNIALWMMDGGAVLAAAVINAVTPDWKIAGTGDLNGDSKADILWRNDNGSVALWQMNGSNVTAGATIGTASTDWKITGTGDFNADGKSDILWRNDLGGVATWQMNGATVLSAGLTSIPSADLSWKVAALIL